MSSRRKSAAAFAVALMIGMPLTAFFLAPSAGAASGPPGSGLAGINAEATATGAQFEPLLTGVIPAGNVTTGSFFQVSLPYSDSQSSTGPTNQTVSTPAWPGQTASGVGTAIQTFSSQFPNSLANLLNDHVLARAQYPPQPGIGTSYNYSPPGGSTTGAGNASAAASEGTTTGHATTTDTPLLPGGDLDVASSTATSSTTVEAASVATDATSAVGTVKLLGGLVTIGGVTSDAKSSSNGSLGQESSTLHVGPVTVAGQQAYLSPNGLHLLGSDQGALAVAAFNQALKALQQAGLTVATIAPTEQTQGNTASVTSGAVQIKFIDNNIPNPEGQVPVNLVGVEVDLGLSQGTAQATSLPAIPAFQVPSFPSTPLAAPATTPPATTVSSAGQTVTQSAVAPTPAPPTAIGQTSSPTTPYLNPQPAAILGVPVRVAWVVIAVLLSIVMAGPLLAYANWQLLRGRS